MSNTLVSNIKKNYLSYLIILCGILGAYASFTLLNNRIEYYKNPDYIPPCSINVWLDCGVVMKSKWAELFGFPNTVIGLTTYPLAIFTGFIILLNEKNNANLMKFATLMALIGTIINFILLYISAYLIGSLCPWCILAGVATSNIFLALSTHIVQKGYLTAKNSTLNNKLLQISKLNNITLITLSYYMFLAFFVWFAFYLRQNGVLTTEFIDPIFWKWNKS